MRIALAQLVSGPDPAANLDLVAEHAGRAGEQGADLLVCPEATMRSSGCHWARSPSRSTGRGRRG